MVAPRFAKRIVLALDADEAGQNAARRSLDVARQTLSRDYAGKLSVDVAILQIPAGKDPDDFLREAPEGWPALVDNAQGVADFVINMETAALRAAASLQERQAVAQTLLPLLLASENNVYKQDNLQKLARRLRISERDMLAWAQEQTPLVRPQPRAPIQDEPPDYPPEYWDNEYDMPPVEADAATEPAETGALSQAAKEPLTRAIEAFCLGVLLKNPDLLYQVNRKLRELAADDEDLLRGPLGGLSADDFTQSQYRALMASLQESMEQDDMSPLEYLGSVLEEDMRAEVRMLLISDPHPNAVAERLNGNFRVDLDDILRKGSRKARPSFSLQDKLIVRALQLRRQRLDIERVEMQYLQEEAQSGTDRDARLIEQISARIRLTMRAKTEIDRAVS